MSLQDQIRVREVTKETIELARSIFPNTTIPTPVIQFSNRMTKRAGQYTYDPRYGNPLHSLQYSIPIIHNNDTEAFCADTVIHEVAHFIDKVVYGSTGHNARFYAIMRKLGHKNPKRLHTFKVQSKRKTYAYKCSCCGSDIGLGAIRHRKIQYEGAKYFHTDCGRRGTLVFIG